MNRLTAFLRRLVFGRITPPLPIDAPAAPEAPAAPACPFYGYNAIPEFRILASSGGNQCALKIGRFAPCMVEVYLKQPPEWSTCPLSGPYRPACANLARVMIEWRKVQMNTATVKAAMHNFNRL